MLNKVHHVTYAVNSIADIADYMENNFDLKPIRVDEFTDRGFKSVLFQVGETLVDFFEPIRDDTALARQLRETGPGVMHVAWGVDDIDGMFNDLKAKGNELRGEGPSVSPYGYKTANIEPSSSHNIHFQLAEGEHS
ncbi:Methylmalonyl-CoA epimerase [Geodia barretti]|uniref:Methylmalonyl-CoA epimerase n=1 Tax=Geodia barretti TaxID=519541 RepID=A0AA35T9G1_GEOBA|nr:Methylmalonyl-CoA epimerase [Geodia barretti]